MEQKKQSFFEAEEVQRIISRMAHEIVEKSGDIEDLALIGIRTRGSELVRRIAHNQEQGSGTF